MYTTQPAPGIDSDAKRQERVTQRNLEIAENAEIINKLVILFYGIATTGLGIYAVIIGAQSTNACLSDYKIGTLGLNTAVLVYFIYSVTFIPAGFGICISACAGKKKTETSTVVGCYACFVLIWFILFSIILFNSDCKQKDTQLYNAGLILFIYTFAGSVSAAIIGCIINIWYISFAITEDIIKEAVAP